jgi:RNA polymerase sigma factor (sigma-70 family)
MRFLSLTISTLIERKNMHTGKRETVKLKRALESVIENNGGKWFRFILGILRNEADAEDAIQEAVRRVLTRNRPFPSEEDVRMYLGRAIGNTAFEMYNTLKRNRMRHTPMRESTLLQDNVSGPDICMEAKEERRRKDRMLGLLNEALERLPEKQEHALRITILESDGLSLRNVGEIHNIPYSTLRHRHKKGLERMRCFLENKMQSGV